MRRHDVLVDKFLGAMMHQVRHGCITGAPGRGRESSTGWWSSRGVGTATRQLVAAAHKVVGVGTVWTRCWTVLMGGRHVDDFLLLQMKESQEPALGAHVGKTPRGNQDSRVVGGQRFMQTTGDILLGWTRGVGLDGRARYFYLRQPHDWKGSAPVQAMIPKGMRVSGQLCAVTLAR
jgi:hypothetical protein